MNFHVTIKYDSNLKPSEMAQQIAAATKNSYLVHIAGVPYEGYALSNYYDELTHHIGQCLELGEAAESKMVEGKWTHVCYDPTIQDAYRSSRNAQPLHTDGAYQNESPDASRMYCISTAPQGGETVFISGERIVAFLQADMPLLFNKLITTPVCFSRKFMNGANTKTRKIIELDEQGNVTLTWNYYRVDPASSASVKQLCEDFHNYLQKNIMGSDKLLAIQLQPGEAVLCLDEKILHGRNSFVAHQYGDRNLVKTSMKLYQHV